MVPVILLKPRKNHSLGHYTKRSIVLWGPRMLSNLVHWASKFTISRKSSEVAILPCHFVPLVQSFLASAFVRLFEKRRKAIDKFDDSELDRLLVKKEKKMGKFLSLNLVDLEQAGSK